MTEREIYQKELRKKFKKLSHEQKKILFFRLALRTLVGLQYFKVRSDEQSREYFYIVFFRNFIAYLESGKSLSDFGKPKSLKLLYNASAATYPYPYPYPYPYAYAYAYASASADTAYAYASAAVYADTYSDIDTYAAAYAADAAYAYAFKNRSFSTIFKNSLEKDFTYLLQNSHESLKDEKLFFDEEVDTKMFIEPLETINPVYGFVVEHLINPAMKGKLFKSKVLLEALESLSEQVLALKDGVALCDFLQKALTGELEDTKRARVILLGSGGAGKTSLVKNIKEQGKAKVDEIATPRIEISSWETAQKTEVKFWDFGGQVIMHSTHTFFLSFGATYIVVCNYRNDEEPDEWLELICLQSTKKSDENAKSNVLLVYTHCESEVEIQSAKKSATNRLKRLYSKELEIQIFALSNTKITDKEDENEFNEALDAFKTKLVELADIQGKTQEDKLYKKMENKHDGNIYTFKALTELRDKLDTTTKDMDSFLDVMINYGYIFRAKPKGEESYKYKDEDKFIWQRHWLTYGVYELINSPKVREKNGQISRLDFDSILNNGKNVYIKEDGSVSKDKIEDYDEIIFYTEDHRDVLYEIVKNYAWAVEIDERRRELLFPHALSLDEPEKLGDYIVSKEEESLRLLEVDFTILPKDFFFRFIALCKEYIDEKLLFRKGAVLFLDGTQKQTFAYVMIRDKQMKIEVSGEEHIALMSNLKRKIETAFKEYKGLEARILHGVKDKDGKIHMLDENLMKLLDTDAEGYIKEITKTREEQNMRGIIVNVQTPTEKKEKSLIKESTEFSKGITSAASAIAIIVGAIYIILKFFDHDIAK